MSDITFITVRGTGKYFAESSQAVLARASGKGRLKASVEWHYGGK